MKKESYSNIMIIVTAAVLLEFISAAQYYYMRHELSDELDKRAEAELTFKAVVTKSNMNQWQKMMEGYTRDIANDIETPDSMFSISASIVRNNPHLLGCGIAFRPDFYPQKGRLYEPYAMRQGDDIVVRQVAGPHHDYTKDGFYKAGMETGKPHWMDPYFDSVFNKQIVSYVIPLLDQNGSSDESRIAGVFGIDVPLDWLGDTLNYRHVYPSSYDLLLTEKGELITGPSASLVSPENVEQIVDLMNDDSVEKEVSNTGRSKMISFTDKNGRDGVIYYAFFKGYPRWQVAVVCYDDEVYGKLRKTRFFAFLLSIAGLLLLGYILYRTTRNIRRLEAAHMEQERIGSELRIASRIQMEMLPARNTAYKERADLSVSCLLEPAKTVGGDLFDHFVRDEKLFFCIGDVSGKGVPAAIVMAVIHSLFRMASAHENNPARIMQTINEVSCQNNQSNMFVTLFIGVLDLPTGHLRYCNAGHDIPVVVGQGELPAKANLPVGVIADFKYEIQSVTLTAGQLLFLYTDGLTEARNRQNQQFRLERVMELLQGCEGLTSKQLLDRVTDGVRQFMKDTPQSDDLTMMVISYTPVTLKSILDEELTLKNDVRQVTELNNFVKRVTGQLDMTPSLAKNLRLAVEEAVVNVMSYAYPANIVGDVNVRVTSDGSTLQFTITDSGVAFDPTEALQADTSLSAEDRPIGGLGILLVRELMDSINYERIDGKNVLTLFKKL